jgi:hypothetical protein
MGNKHSVPKRESPKRIVQTVKTKTKTKTKNQKTNKKPREALCWQRGPMTLFLLKVSNRKISQREKESAFGLKMIL